eukprot:c10852_g1_i1 orf=74-280(+)
MCSVDLPSFIEDTVVYKFQNPASSLLTAMFVMPQKTSRARHRLLSTPRFKKSAMTKNQHVDSNFLLLH